MLKASRCTVFPNFGREASQLASRESIFQTNMLTPLMCSQLCLDILGITAKDFGMSMKLREQSISINLPETIFLVSRWMYRILTIPAGGSSSLSTSNLGWLIIMSRTPYYFPEPACS